MTNLQPDRALGIRENLRPFLQQLLQVFFVGMTIGRQCTLVPGLAESEFSVPEGSMTALFAFVVTFGVVKAAMNFVSGHVSERYGRRRVLIAGWIVALAIPFMILRAPSWSWIVAANVLLGVNQGFCWSMTVTAKLDIVPAGQRGLATGLNDFAGYGGLALAGLGTGYLASFFEPRASLFVFGLAVILLALLSAWSEASRPSVFAAQFALSHACWPLTCPLAGVIGATFGMPLALAALGLMAATGFAIAVLVWPAADPDVLEHEHRGLPPSHPHLRNAVPTSRGWRHAHLFVIDEHHRSWPVQG